MIFEGKALDFPGIFLFCRWGIVHCKYVGGCRYNKIIKWSIVAVVVSRIIFS